VQASVRPDVLARVAAIDLVGSEGGQPVGYALAGPLAAAIGAHAFLTASAVIMAAAGAAFTFGPARRADASAGPQGPRNETPVSSRTGGARTGGESGYHGPFGKMVYFISGVPRGRGLPPVPAADALKNR
jgi:hypothetical protein